jgi:hypothetical protein
MLASREAEAAMEHAGRHAFRHKCRDTQGGLRLVPESLAFNMEC